MGSSPTKRELWRLFLFSLFSFFFWSSSHNNYHYIYQTIQYPHTIHIPTSMPFIFYFLFLFFFFASSTPSMVYYVMFRCFISHETIRHFPIAKLNFTTAARVASSALFFSAFSRFFLFFVWFLGGRCESKPIATFICVIIIPYTGRDMQCNRALVLEEAEDEGNRCTTN